MGTDDKVTLREDSTALPFRITPTEAAARFRRAMTTGFFRPPDLARSGVWKEPVPTLVPAWVFRIALTCNWTAMSGTRGRKDKVTWSPVTGQHSGTYENLALLATTGPWKALAPALLASLDAGGSGVTAGAATLPDTVDRRKLIAEAVDLARSRATDACHRMVPGNLKKQLKVNAVVESGDGRRVLVPLYEVAVIWQGTELRGWVDGRSGRVKAPVPTSNGRVAGTILGALGAVAAVVAGFVIMSSAGAVSLAAKSAALAEEGREAEAARVEAVRAEWASAQPGLAEKVGAAQAALAARDAVTARGALEVVLPVLERLDPDVEDPALDALLVTTREAGAAIARLETIARGMAAARSVAADADACGTPKRVGEVWTDLREVHKADPEWKEAVSLTAKLERCRATAERDLSKGMRDIMIAQRVELSEQMETLYLDQGMDVRVTVSGAAKDQLRMSYVLFGRALAHQMTDGGSTADGSLLGKFQKAGFKKVIFADGYSESWTYTLEPPPEGDGGRAILAGFGLGAPLTLTADE